MKDITKIVVSKMIKFILISDRGDITGRQGDFLRFKTSKPTNPN